MLLVSYSKSEGTRKITRDGDLGKDSASLCRAKAWGERKDLLWITK